MADMNRGGKVVDSGPGLIERVAAAARFAITGDSSQWGGWFGPGQPLAPIAQEAEGRQQDYPFGVNIQGHPRANEQVTFETLRGLADGYDLLRLAIETRKDQMEKMAWIIRQKDGRGTEARAQELTEFFYFPDKLNTWPQWLRALLEDLLVIDAPTAYNRKTLGGQPFAIELIDGATIQRLVAEDGRTPHEGPAYQQILKGVKAVDYTRDELLYMPRNVRTNKLYGFSPVEQVLMTVNIAIRRQVNQLSYYTEGNVPDLIIGLPKDWQPSAVRQFSEWWNSLSSSEDQTERRKTRFVPDGLKVIDTKDRTLKDAYDEWLARVICYAFSVSPQALVAQMNRATAETAQETAIQEGLAPLLLWVKSFIDSILIRFFQEDDYEFAWVEEKAMDPLEQAQIHEIQLRAGLRTVDEIREADLKLDARETPEPATNPDGSPVVAGAMPVTGGSVQDTALNGAQIASMLAITDAVHTGSLPKPSAIAVIRAAFPQFSDLEAGSIVNPIEVKEPEPVPAPLANQAPAAPGAPPVAQGKASATPVKEKSKVPEPGTKKLAKAAQPSSLDREAVVKAEKKLRAAWKKWFRSQVNPVASQITESLGKLSKAATDEERVAAIMKDLGFKNTAVIRDTTQKMLESIYKDAGYEALQKIAADAADYDKMLSVVNEEAVEWAKTDAAKLITNVDSATRDMLKGSIEEALNEGLSTQDLADLLADNHAFSDERAETIARTELAFANVQGTVNGYKESGVVSGVEWLLAQGEYCEECEAMVGKSGTLEDGIDGEFPPLHPNCRCDITPVLTDETQGEE